MRTAAPYLPLEEGPRPASKWRWAAALLLLLLPTAAACAVCTGLAAPRPTAAAVPAAAAAGARAAPGSLAADPVQWVFDEAIAHLSGWAPTIAKALLAAWTIGRPLSAKHGGLHFLTHQDWTRWVSFYDIFNDNIGYWDARRRMSGGEEHKCLIYCGPRTPYEPILGQLERLAVYHLLVPFIFLFTLHAYSQELGFFAWTAAFCACTKFLVYFVMLWLFWLWGVLYLFYDPIMDGAHRDVPGSVLVTFMLAPDVWLAALAHGVMWTRGQRRPDAFERLRNVTAFLCLFQLVADIVVFLAALPVVYTQLELGVAFLSVSLGWIPAALVGLEIIPEWFFMIKPGSFS